MRPSSAKYELTARRSSYRVIGATALAVALFVAGCGGVSDSNDAAEAPTASVSGLVNQDSESPPTTPASENDNGDDSTVSDDTAEPSTDPVVASVSRLDDGQGPLVAPLAHTDRVADLLDGDLVPNGSQIDTRQSTVVLTHPDGSVATLLPNTIAAVGELNATLDGRVGGTQLFLGDGEVLIEAEDPDSTYEILTEHGTILIEGSEVLATCRAFGELQNRQCWAQLQSGAAALDPTTRIVSTCVRRDVTATCWESLVQVIDPSPGGSTYQQPAPEWTDGARPTHRDQAGRLSYGRQLVYESVRGLSSTVPMQTRSWLDLAAPSAATGDSGIGDYLIEQDGVYTINVSTSLKSAVVSHGEVLTITENYELRGPNYLFPQLAGGGHGPGEVVCDLDPGFPPDSFNNRLVGFVPLDAATDIGRVLFDPSTAPLVLSSSLIDGAGQRRVEGCETVDEGGSERTVVMDLPPGLYVVTTPATRLPWRTIDQSEYDFTLLSGAPPRVLVLP